MSTTVNATQTPSTTGLPTAARRFGYVVAVVVNAVALWAVNQLLVWGWPGFLTDEFEQVLPLISVSLIASMVVNAGFLVRDRGRFRALGDLVNAVFGVAISVRLVAVFPFDFAGYATDWSRAVRVTLIVGIVVMSIAVVVNLVKLVTGEPITSRTPTASPQAAAPAASTNSTMAS